MKVQFNPAGNGTVVFVEQGEFASAESKEGHKQGWHESFVRLIKVVRARES